MKNIEKDSTANILKQIELQKQKMEEAANLNQSNLQNLIKMKTQALDKSLLDTSIQQANKND